MPHAKLTLRLISFFFLFSLFLSACARTVTQPDPITKSQPTETRTLPTFAPTETTTATVQLQPSRTLAHPEPTGTPFFKATEIAQFPVQCTDFWLAATIISPVGDWVAISCGYKRDQNLEIVNQNGARWILNYKDYLPKKYIVNGETPIGSLYPKHWSNDGRYLYFTSDIGFDGECICSYGFGVQGLYRVNVKDGAVSAVLPASDSVDGYEIAFSPTGRRLAYQGEGEPVILDLQTGDKLTIRTGDDVIGNFTWSPDGLELAYSTCSLNPIDNDLSIQKSAIKIYSVQTNSSQLILEIEKTILFIVSWDKNDILKIAQGSYSDEQDGVPYDLNSRQWLVPTPTTEP